MLNLQDRLSNSAFVFRGYNVTNLGRSRELLAHHAYGPVVEHHLREASAIASELLGRKIDLVARVERGEETDLETYADAVALILGMEQAQLKLLDEFFRRRLRPGPAGFGYSLGEIGALVASGVHGFANCAACAAGDGGRLHRAGPRCDARRAVLARPGARCRCGLTNSACGSTPRAKA